MCENDVLCYLRALHQVKQVNACCLADIWTQSQEEGEPKFEVKSAELQSETKAVFKIALYYPDKTSKEMTLMLVYERGNWYIDDFITSFERKESSFKEELIDCIKQTEKYFEENKSSNKGHDFGLNKAHHHHLVGTFEDSSGVYPIELDFDSSGRDVSDVVYTNVKVGSKIHLTCTYFDFWKITVSGKDGSNDFEITLECASESLFKGTAVDSLAHF